MTITMTKAGAILELSTQRYMKNAAGDWYYLGRVDAPAEEILAGDPLITDTRTIRNLNESLQELFNRFL